MTGRLTVTMDDRLAALVRDAAARETGGNVSEWLTRAATSRLLAADAAALAAWDAAHPDERSAELAEREAEREARWAEGDRGRGAA
ncbi:hypothetical protein AB0M22_44985 [Nocardia sp. NPDC051756]|uniref:hypothetical protein n=1 Tax=Nocardia sp. NPDC051756 TaxID=3154751 RepID=UPI0034374761